MDKLRVLDWTDWENYEGYIELDRLTIEDEDKIQDVIIKELKEKGYKFTGSYHQQGEFGAPVLGFSDKFEDKFIYKTTQRVWGGIVADAFPENNLNDGYDYCRWAWLVPEDEEQVIPSKN